jgi:hypothetical protein
MLKWLYNNVDHITVPLGMLFGLLAAIMGFTSRYRQKEGKMPPYFSRGFSIVMLILLVVGFVFLGMVLVHTFVKA